MPKGRKILYTIWRSCERFGMRPPSVSDKWDDCSGVIQSYMLTYEQIRQNEEVMTNA